MQQFQVGGFAVMPRYAGAGMLGVEDRIGDELFDVVICQAVKDRGAVPARLNQAGHPQFRKVLRNARSRLADMLGYVADRHLLGNEGPQNLDAGGIGQHAEDLDHQVDLIRGKLTTTSILICIHKQILSLELTASDSRSPDIHRLNRQNRAGENR